MKYLLPVLLLFSMSIYAQITITSDDMSKMFTLGYSTTVHEFDGNGSIFIDSTGGGNVWDFSGLQGNLTYDLLSVDKSEAPYPGEFPDADIITYEKDNSNSGQLELWSYYSLDGSFGNLGSSGVVNTPTKDTVVIKNSPARIEVQFPMTYNSAWSQTYDQTVFAHGMPSLNYSVSRNVVVDAFGTLLLPGGDSSEALRLRETTTISTPLGDSTTVSYFFISKDGGQVSLTTNSSNPPAEGTININGYSWNVPPHSNGGGSGMDVFNIQKPDSSDIVIAGEIDTIKYSGQKGKVSLFYSIDKGQHFALIDSNQLFSPYYWKVPDSLLTTKAIIKGIDDSTGIPAYSGPFKIKPWQLSRIDTNGNFQLFIPNRDGWGFVNNNSPNGPMWPEDWWKQFDYLSGKDPNTDHIYFGYPFFVTASKAFPDWPLFADVFGIKPPCYIRINSPIIYNTAATLKWHAINDDWKGSCEGFSVTSLLGFYHHQKLTEFIPDYKDYDSLSTVPFCYDAQYVINYFQIHQDGKAIQKNRKPLKKKSTRQLLSELKDMLSKDNVDGKILEYWESSDKKSAGHCVVPYKLKRIENSSNFKILLYNPNKPKNNKDFIYLDSTANTWSDSTGFNWGTASSHCYLYYESGEALSRPKLFSIKNISKSFKKNNADILSDFILYNSSKSEVTITSSNGKQIGFKDSTTFNEINNADPIIPITSRFHPPIGYDLPPDNYSIQMDNFKDSISEVLFDMDSIFYDYKRNNAINSESDIFKYSAGGIEIKNPDASEKNITLETVVNKNISEKVFQTDNLTLVKNDSIKIKKLSQNDLLLNNYGRDKTYDLTVKTASEDGEMIFNHPQIQLGSNSSHQIIPVWDDLENSLVKILIDNGNDGTVDDSIFVDNQTTGTKEKYTSNKPNKFQLHQNYPNPFNPTTTINYTIPNSSLVKLKVYDILGREVETLVNERKSPGNYSVEFNASRLASGIYFYRMQAGDFVATKKLILMK
jgi:hypothetical protein